MDSCKHTTVVLVMCMVISAVYTSQIGELCFYEEISILNKLEQNSKLQIAHVIHDMKYIYTQLLRDIVNNEKSLPRLFSLFYV